VIRLKSKRTTLVNTLLTWAQFQLSLKFLPHVRNLITGRKSKHPVIEEIRLNSNNVKMNKCFTMQSTASKRRRNITNKVIILTAWIKFRGLCNSLTESSMSWQASLSRHTLRFMSMSRTATCKVRVVISELNSLMNPRICLTEFSTSSLTISKLSTYVAALMKVIQKTLRQHSKTFRKLWILLLRTSLLNNTMSNSTIG